MRKKGLTATVILAGLAWASAAHAQPSDRYAVHNIVSSDTAKIAADRADPNLRNPWGLAASATSPWWPANERSNTSTIVPASGAVNNTVVTVPGGPTGITTGAGAGNFLTLGNPAAFIFSTLGGELYSWRGGVPNNNGVRQLTRPGAVYTGMALATVAGAPRLYVADLRNNRIDMVNAQWGLIDAPGAFVDPNLPGGYGAYGVQTVGNRIIVTYAQQPADPAAVPYRERRGAGLGVVNAFDLSGNFLARIASPGGVLNAPWGTALAHANFGAFAGDLLIGNFGGGRINAFHENPDGTWTHSGFLNNTAGDPLVLPGLWALQFGNGNANSGPRNWLYYTAGPMGESEGVLGRIMPNPLDVSATVPATLSLTLSTPAPLGPFVPGVAATYTTTATANVISTAGDATLSVDNPGPLTNGAFALPQPLQVSLSKSTWTAPVSNDPVTVTFTQPIGANDALRTGTYSRTLTFTLSTTNP
ncbi:TIGR03118 family protein [Solirubrobacter sp. CPCC 204708]|uniref:TIGR03118 family protein n=1 Tax=Solirubrobacter deserti TaxID=2282478 RepID=A0ABT4RE96_9ACTN|nr:TIGR03118 family protein [Solirubrobacter deserti]MBE2316098.1 TIGR03118 family protein [Solirubrobacter deserti]MDA0136848.1 TIGR03118 family protein [Solirubrobacter deserti]